MTPANRIRLTALAGTMLQWGVPDRPGWVFFAHVGGCVAAWLLPDLWADRRRRLSLALAAVVAAGMVWEVWPWAVLVLSCLARRWAGDRPAVRRRITLLMAWGAVFGLAFRPALALCIKEVMPWGRGALPALVVLVLPLWYFARRERFGFWVLSPAGRLGALGALCFAALGACRALTFGDSLAVWAGALTVAAVLALTAQLAHSMVVIDPAIRRGAVAGEVLAAAVLGVFCLTAVYFLPYRNGFAAENEWEARKTMTEWEPRLDETVARFRAAYGRWPEAWELAESERRPFKARRVIGSRPHGDGLLLYCQIPLTRSKTVVVRHYLPEGPARWCLPGRNHLLKRMLPVGPLPALADETAEK